MSTITQVQGVTPSELSQAFANQVEVIIVRLHTKVEYFQLNLVNSFYIS